MYKKIELTSEWRSFRENFTATADEENARIHFDVGEIGISVDLSSVILCGLEDGKSIESGLTAIRYGEPERDKASLENLPDHGYGEKI